MVLGKPSVEKSLSLGLGYGLGRKDRAAVYFLDLSGLDQLVKIPSYGDYRNPKSFGKVRDFYKILLVQ
jgi:hypothetical protein